MSRKLIAALLLSVSLVSLGGVAVTAQNGSGPNDVPMFRGNPARTGEMPGPGPDPNQDVVQRWSYPAGDEINSSPAVVDGVVYVGSWDGFLYAIDAATGDPHWAFPTDGLIFSSPAVAGGVVYIGSGDGVLYAIDAPSGQQRWTFQAQYSIRSSPVVVDGVVFAGSEDGFLYAIDAATGLSRWAADLSYPIDSSPAIADGIVYVGNDGASIVALDAATGQQRWTFHTGGIVGTAPAYADGVVYATSWDGSLYAIDATTGEQIWNFPTQQSIPPAPAVAGRVVYFVGGDGSLHAIDTISGQQRWVFQEEQPISSAPAVADSIVYAASSSGALHALDAASGQELWSFSTGRIVDSSPTVVNGVVYIGSADGSLYAIGNPITDEHPATTGPGTTATEIADTRATEEAIRQDWNTYFQAINIELAASGADLYGLGISSDYQMPCDGPEIGFSFVQCARYPVSVIHGSGGTYVALAILDSTSSADAALQQMSSGLTRSGWQIVDVDGLDHDHVCLTFVTNTSSDATCYLTRDDALIVSHSHLDLNAPDSVLLNAVDLARTMSDAYDQIDRPADLGSRLGDVQ